MADIEYLKTLQAVRERAHVVLKLAKQGVANNFIYNEGLMGDVAEFVVNVIKRDFGPDKYDQIPPHGRWQHFDVGGVPRVARMLETWGNEGVDKVEAARRLVDLFFVSVLLDAGAGDVWTFTEQTGHSYGRSEGIAVASLYMFTGGAFSEAGSPAVDAQGLLNLTPVAFEKQFQVTDENPIIGSGARVALLNRVGTSLLRLTAIFGDTGRPGKLVDYLLAKEDGSPLDYEVLWTVLQELLLPAWPEDRTHISGIPIGDAWPLEVLKQATLSDSLTAHIQPFHKLTQWLGYSLTLPFSRLLGLSWKNMELGTGLPEYRNGGLFVDLGALELRKEVRKKGLAADAELPSFSASGDVIVEWRALTVALLDELHTLVNLRFAEEGVKLTMAQMLEAGTWKGGRELAAKHRPHSKSSPILIEGDGTLF